jgi:glucosamine--fructose-6-phosphate aminotransferase (isomerizing)
MSHDHSPIESAYPESAYVRDILDQPRAIRDTIAVLAESEELNDFTKGLSATRYQSIVLTGMGNSFHILTPLYLKLIELGFSVLMAETSELIHFMPRLLGNRTVLIVVSQSGRSGEIVRLLSMKGEGATILGVTNDPTSPLAMESDVVALIQAGPEASVACKTTTASLAALAWIGEYMATTDLSSTKDRLEPIAPAVERYLAYWKNHVNTISAELRGIRHFFVTGRGPSLAASGVGGLLMKEAAHFHSEGLSSAAFRHGPFEMLSEACFVLVFAGDDQVEPLNRALVEDIRAAGAKAVLAGPEADAAAFRLSAVGHQIRPILEMLPLQMTSLALAQMAGHEAGKFERIAKVTTAE